MVVEERKQRRRIRHPKVKTGCGTCKIRKIKCDEAKPECLRCSSTGRKCDGYNSNRLVSSPNSSSTMAVIRLVATNMPGNAEEKRGFNYFLANTAPGLSGYYSNSFWESLILQASSGEPSLRHAVIAIGSLHEEFANQRLEYDANGNTGFAADQYRKAIGHLRRSLASGKHSPLTALMSCILFVCFDSIRANFTSAMVHLQSGVRILRDIRQRGSSDSFMIETIIAPVLSRLTCQAILYIDTRSQVDRAAFAFELTKSHTCDETVPECFSNLEEARNSLNESADGLFRMFWMYDADLPYCYQPVETSELYQRYNTNLCDWNPAFEKFMNLKSAAFNSLELRGAALLKIQHTVVKVMADTASPNLSDMRKISEIVNEPAIYAPFTANFQTVVNLSRSLIAAAEFNVKNGKPALAFSSDLGLVAPLYYVCTKCTEPGPRNAALELLKRCPRREGMWDGEATSRMIVEYWDIKKRHAALQEESEKVFGVSVALSEVVGLEMADGMVWEWRWKGMNSIPSSSSGYSWPEMLDEQGLFGGFFQTTDHGGS